MIVYTHPQPDLDAGLSLYLLKLAFGNDFITEVRFTQRPPQGSPAIDVGGVHDPSKFQFDHHGRGIAAIPDQCTAELVATHINEQGFGHRIAHLMPLVQYIGVIDLGLIAAPPPNVIDLQMLMRGWKLTGPYKSDNDILSWMWQCFDWASSALKAHSEGQSGYTQSLVYESAHFAALLDSTHSATEYAHTRKPVVLFTQRIKNSRAIGLVRARGVTIISMADVAREVVAWYPQLESEVGKWSLHPAGFFAGRGTAKHPDPSPIAVDFSELAMAVSEVVEDMLANK